MRRSITVGDERLERCTALDDGAEVPSRFDGMAAFSGANGTVVLVRNHEIRDSAADRR